MCKQTVRPTESAVKILVMLLCKCLPSQKGERQRTQCLVSKCFVQMCRQIVFHLLDNLLLYAKIGQ